MSSNLIRKSIMIDPNSVRILKDKKQTQLENGKKWSFSEYVRQLIEKDE